MSGERWSRCACQNNKALKRLRKAGRWPPKGLWRVTTYETSDGVKVLLVFPCGCHHEVHEDCGRLIIRDQLLKRMGGPPQSIVDEAISLFILLRSSGMIYDNPNPPF